MKNSKTHYVIDEISRHLKASPNNYGICKAAFIKYLIVILLFVLTSGFTDDYQNDKEVFAITGAKIRTLAGDDIEEGVIVVSGKNIQYVGSDLTKVPEDAKIVKAEGKLIVPGYIDLYTYIGLVEIGAVDMTRDDYEKGEIIAPHLWTGDAYNTQSELRRVTRINGVTTVLSAPAFGNIMAGRSVLVNLVDSIDIDNVIVSKYAAVHVNIGSPKGDGDDKGKKSVTTRMGVLAETREALIKAKEYIAKRKRYDEKLKDYNEKMSSDKEEERKKAKKPDEPAINHKNEVLSEVLGGKIPVMIYVNRADDILRAVKLADEFGFKLILAGCAEIWKVVDDIAVKKIPVILGPINVQPDNEDRMYASYENAYILFRKGVKFCISTFEEHNVRNLPYMAGLAAAYGLPKEEALKAITLYPAQILGVDNLIGSIKEGAMANFIIYDTKPVDPKAKVKSVTGDDPLQPLMKVESVYIQGQEISLENHQTELYDKYK